MACRITELVIKCRDPQRLAAFWCDVLGFTVLGGSGGVVGIGPREGFGGPQPVMVFLPIAEPPPGRLRLNFDISTDGDRDAELERLLKLGARPAGISQTGDEPRHVLADPEGNEFRLV